MAVDEALRDEIETVLRRDLDAWFPRTVDERYGGFLCDFDYRWRAAGPQPKMLEYQVRQTLAAARAAVRFPESEPLRQAAVHGFRYLNDRMWDQSAGGWYRMLDRTGRPLEASTKHGHGSSYAIMACIACHELTAAPECLGLAKAAFGWLEEHAHDKTHGGYFVFYERDGTPILSVDQAPTLGQDRDCIGTPLGFKDANTTSDLLRAFSDLYRVWPNPLLETRLKGLLHIVRDRLVVAPGVMHMYMHPDWTPVPGLARYGQILRSANLLFGAARVLGEPTTARVVKSMVDTMLRVAWDHENGGFCLGGSSFGPDYVEENTVFLSDKVWWLQAEGLMALLTMAHEHPDDVADYSKHFSDLWTYVRRYMIDAKRGGWLSAGLDSNRAARKRPKATMWKDSSHETEALLDCLHILDTW